MAARRVLAIGLDGYEQSFAAEMMRAGELPALSKLHESSARFLLDHGAAQRIGLAWEHVATGMSPEAMGRWAAVSFDPQTYRVWQEGTSVAPFPAELKARSVVFDPMYFDLAQAPSVRGIVDWGAHDPGGFGAGRPDSLRHEIVERFGPYPARDSIYGFVWPSAERTERAGAALVKATEQRGEIARWLLSERMPDWELGLVVTSDLHSAVEAMWHGVDPSHPLHALPSAAPAGEAMRNLYRATDRLVGDLQSQFDDAAIVVFSMGGMGPNRSDIQSMILLPELLYRHAFGRPFMRVPDEWQNTGAIGPQLDIPGHREWNRLMCDVVPDSMALQFVERALNKARRELRRFGVKQRGPQRLSMRWMPASRYRDHWPRMSAFALPSFYDGRVRINIAGRERNGIVPPERYAEVCDEIEALARECTDSATGECAVDFVERPCAGDPMSVGPSQSDMVIVWRSSAIAFDHPLHGRIGPMPFRRPGGHTGRYGMAYIAAGDVHARDGGVRSSFDVVPTLIDLLGEPLPAGLSGSSLLRDGYVASPK